MRRFLCCPGQQVLALLLVLGSQAVAQHATTRQRVAPLLIRKEQNPLLRLTVHVRETTWLEAIALRVEGHAQLESLQMYLGKDSQGQAFGERAGATREVRLTGSVRLVPGEHHFWLSCRVRPQASLTERVDASVESIVTSEGVLVPVDETPEVRKRVGVALRRAGDDGVHTYRIPALATTKRGSLLVAYDMRRRARRDLQEDIDIGLLRSRDGGRSWEPQRVIMDMGHYGGKGQAQNGCSDPGLIVDPQTGAVFCFAVWMHGQEGKHQWNVGGSQPGFEIGKSAQFMMVRSQDDGRSWSMPENRTRDFKRPEWGLYAPSPQQGIALADGTLVMPTGGRDAQSRRFSNLLISRDHGKSWQVSEIASVGNSECQAVALPSGGIMLNCRSDGPKFRTVAVTHDLGATWQPHSTNRKVLIEPHCNGSLMRFDYRDGAEARSVLLFANPHSQSSRTHQSIQVSFDEGQTWPREHRLLLDEGRGNGYPSLSRVDARHVGIVYEGSGAHLVFEKIPIAELLGDRD